MKNNNKEKKNILWKILLIVGCIPYVYIIFNAISNTINRDWGFCIGGDCSATYGITAFKNTFFWGLILLWQINLIALTLIIISVIMLIKKRKKK